MSKIPTFSLCVYCGSRAGTQAAYTEAAMAVGHWIGQRAGQLVYGGGNSGLMGVVAKSTLEAGGQVVGVIPRSLLEREYANHDCTELHVVDTMHQRKHMMAEQADAFLALPGGIGTFEELFEVWTWNQLGYHNKPVGLLNTQGYYDALLTFLDQSIAHGFVGPWQRDLLCVGTETDVLLAQLIQNAGLNSPSQLRAI